MMKMHQINTSFSLFVLGSFDAIPVTALQGFLFGRGPRFRFSVFLLRRFCLFSSSDSIDGQIFKKSRHLSAVVIYFKRPSSGLLLMSGFVQQVSVPCLVIARNKAFQHQQ